MLVQEVPSCTAGNERRLQRKSVSAPVCTFTATFACPGRHPAPEVSGSLGMAQACTEWGGMIYGKSCFTVRGGVYLTTYIHTYPDVLGM